MKNAEPIHHRNGQSGKSLGLEERYAYYRRCQVMRERGQCKAPALRDRQVCYKHAEQQERASQCRREMAEVLMEGAARTGIEIRNLMKHPTGRQTMLAVVTQAILDGRIGEDAARILLRGLAKGCLEYVSVHHLSG